MSGKQKYCMVLDDDPGMGLSLRHLFSVIGKESCELFSDPEAMLASVDEEPGLRVIILGHTGQIARHRVIEHCLERSAALVVVLDRQEQSDELEAAFLAGAHEVVTVPFGLRALALRLRARVGFMDNDDGLASLTSKGQWEDEAYIAERAGLTSAEAQIAHILISEAGEIVSRDRLSYAIDDRPWDYGDRKFDVHVAKIRKKLDATFGAHIQVKTVRSEGYILSFDADGFQLLLRSSETA